MYFRRFVAAILILIVSIAVYYGSFYDSGVDIRVEKPNKIFSGNDDAKFTQLDSSTLAEPWNLKEGVLTDIIGYLDRLESIRDLSNEKSYLYEVLFNSCSKFTYEDGLVFDERNSDCLSVMRNLEHTLGNTDNVNEKLYVLELLAKWQPRSNQFAFVKYHSELPPTISTAGKFSLYSMLVTTLSTTEDKMSVVKEFSELGNEDKILYLESLFQKYGDIYRLDSQSGQSVDYVEYIADIEKSIVYPDIPSNDPSSWMEVSDWVPRFSSKEKFEEWVSHNPAEAALLAEQLAVNTSRGKVDGLLNRVLYWGYTSDLDGNPKEIASIIAESNLPANELYYTLDEIQRLCVGRGYSFNEYCRSIVENDEIRTQVKRIIVADNELSEGQKNMYRLLYDRYWNV